MWEKAGRLEAVRPSQSHGIAAWMKLALLAVMAFLAFNTLPHLPQLFVTIPGGSLATPGEFAWADVRPSRALRWQTCYNDEYECARLDVPMDWLDPTDKDRVVLAVIRLPAVNRDDYRGPVFFNPGGPGGSGIWSIRDHGKFLQTIVGDNHDIITFDPRGIGKSVPRVQCWEDYQRQHFWQLQDIANIDAHPGVVYDEYARTSAYSGICETANAQSGIMRHLSTASHARDMLEILHQLGEDRLRYWGFSYGTILGGTFAAMYPDRVARLVSDGNVDYREWHLKTHVHFLHDTDKVLDAFFALCYRAGPVACAFYADSPAAIEQRFDRLRDRLRQHPVIVPASVSVSGGDGPELPEIVTYSKLMRLLSSTLYQPHHGFARFATILQGLDRGDGWPYYEHMARLRPPFTSVCTAETLLPTVPPPGLAESNDDAFPAIMCADSVPETATAEQFEQLATQLQTISRAGGAVGALTRLACVGRTVRPKFRFAGPFEGNTSFPILYVNNIADNVTPLISARNNSAGFPSSVVLVQHSYGHTSLSSPSTCTARHIRAYFQDGVVPLPGTECQPDSLPFGLASKTVDSDNELTFAVGELSRRASALSWRLGVRIF